MALIAFGEASFLRRERERLVDMIHTCIVTTAVIALLYSFACKSFMHSNWKRGKESAESWRLSRDPFQVACYAKACASTAALLVVNF